MPVKIISVKLMSVNNKVRNNVSPFQYGFSGIIDLRLVANCHGHNLHAGGLSVNNYARENNFREVNVRE